ncbi:MAG: butyrate kinase [Candidatus Krumholzibacteriota bacterium]|nr:butyrate kinase [Candidatus Krumholzibacteriota bacterium]
MALTILVINPGSTSTKLALWGEDGPVLERTLEHEDGSGAIAAQLPARRDDVLAFLEANGRPAPDAVCGRGGLLRPMEGGTYLIDEAMLDDLRSARYGEHASLLGGLIAHELGRRWRVPAFVVDPVTVDEMDAVARYSGVPEITRQGRSHALSLKAVARLAAAELDKPLGDTRFAAAHLGGGISVAALRGGRIADVNDALLGMGPFSPYRAGALPVRGLLDLAFAPGTDRARLEHRLAKESGLCAYLGTGDLKEIERRIAAGDAAARGAFDAMAYQIAKEIGAMAAALGGELDGVILTGGMARSDLLTERLRDRVGFLGRVFSYPGEREMEALAQGALRVLQGREQAKRYGLAREGGGT